MTITWPLPGYPDEVALSAGANKLWVAASTATLDTEQVWFGEVEAGAVTNATCVLEAGVCCRPAITACAGGGALAIACAPDRLVAARVGASGEISRWQLPMSGVPLQVAAAAVGSHVAIAAELVRGRERVIATWRVDPASGAIEEHHAFGGGSTWCRWPVLAIAGGELVIAWSEGPAGAGGLVKIARGLTRQNQRDVSDEPGEAPALATLPDGAIAVAWHTGGAGSAGDDRDASVVRMIDVAIVRLTGGPIVPIRPPLGAGGEDPRGEDQGWELPALVADRAGSLWLVGRSSHGHHVARRGAGGTWSAPRALDAGGWGGRGRRHALVVHDDRVWLGRRAPDGLVIDVCRNGDQAVARSRRPRVASTQPASRRPYPDVLFGDLHQHTAHSDGSGSLEDLWLAARDHRGLDFAAITDHDQFCRRAIGPASWQLASSVAAGFDEPGRFVALAGYELTLPRYPGPGHKCVYFGDRVPDRVPDRDLDTLFALLRELGGIAVPHHVGWTGADFAHHDPIVQPVWEICSVHGCYEGDGACPAHPPRADHVLVGQFVRDGLAAGLRFGFIGSTDSHGLDWHHGIARWRNPFRAGLACVIGAEPTRSGVIAALRARRSYATTGAKIGLRVELDGAPIGSELPEGTNGELVVEVSGTAPITKIVAVDLRGERTLDVDRHATSPTSASARVRLAPRDGADYVYVRVEQADGEVAWASPFWIGAGPQNTNG